MNRDLPTVEGDLVPLTTILLIFEVVNSPSTLILWEIAEESVIIGLVARFLDDDLGISFVEVVDDVLELVTELEFLEGCETFIIDANTGCLWIRVRRGRIKL